MLPTSSDDRRATEEAAAVRMMLELGIPPEEVAEAAMAARKRATRASCCGIRWEHGAFTQARPCADCPEEVCTDASR